MTAPVLLWGLLEDPTMAAVHAALRRAQAPVVFVNHAAVDRTRVRAGGEGRLEHVLDLDGGAWRLDGFRSAYLRPYSARDYAGADEDHATLVHELVCDWAQHTGATVVNRPSAEATNHCKLAQATVIARGGFAVPESLVSNDHEAIAEFCARHGRVVFKSLSSVRSVVAELGPEMLPSGPMGPVLLQQLVAGIDVRVHIVGGAVFACAVESDAVDYRYGRARLAPVTIPPEVAGRCVALAAEMGLLVAGADFILADDGRWCCLEFNPNPGFSVFDSDGVIAEAVAGLLAGA